MCIDDYLWLFYEDLLKLYKCMWFHKNLLVINDVLTIRKCVYCY